MDDPALVAERLTKVYSGGARALDELDLTIERGVFYGLLGPNGAGKSTLIGIATGLVRADGGGIRIFGRDAAADARTRLLVGVAPQEIHLDRFLDARDLLVYHGRYFGLPRTAAARRADELLDVFDLASRAATKPNRLSGGMRRRLLIARALMHSPQLVALDEPTAGVDLELRHELWTYLRRLQREEGRTILLTTHYIEEAEALCDRVGFIRGGRVETEGTPRELCEAYGVDRLEDAYVLAQRA